MSALVQTEDQKAKLLESGVLVEKEAICRVKVGDGQEDHIIDRLSYG